MGMLRRYRSKFELVSHIVWLTLCIGGITVWYVFFENRFGNNIVAYSLLLVLAVALWPAAKWLTRRLGVEEE